MNRKFDIWPLLAIALLVVSLSILLEVAFELSKISYLSSFGFWQVTTLVINSFAILLIPVAVVLGAIQMLLLGLRNYPRVCRLVRSAVLFPIAIVFVTILFIHLDTFVYTRFHLNVADLPAAANWLLLLGILVAAFFVMIYWGERLMGALGPKVRIIKVVLVLLFLFFGISTVYARRFEPMSIYTDSIAKGDGVELPNIIIFSTDGLDPLHMSAYGYERKTTPVLDEFIKESTIYTKAFTNVSQSRGSVVSTLTGKSPFTTKVIFNPDILTGRDSVENLSGILASMGYYCVAYGPTMHISPNIVNMLGFHSVNGGDTEFGSDAYMDRLKRLYDGEFYFLDSMGGRIWDRVGYMAGLSRKLFYYKAMVLGNEETVRIDRDRIMALSQDIRTVDKPLFAHIHLMKTHGPTFANVFRKFSKGKVQRGKWNDDFYDDAILTADFYFGLILLSLKEAGKLDNTLIVFLTDHGQKSGGNTSLLPLPFVVHLPGQREHWVVDTPVQWLDIAPSVLRHLKIDKPAWMEGAPVFSASDRDRLGNRPIYAIESSTFFEKERGRWFKTSTGPPYYGVGYAAIIKEGYYYKRTLKSGKEEMRPASTDPSSENSIDLEALKLEHKKELFSYLRSKGIGTVPSSRESK